MGLRNRCWTLALSPSNFHPIRDCTIHTSRGAALVRFVVIGEGRPAKALLDLLVEASGATVDALVLKESRQQSACRGRAPARCPGRRRLPFRARDPADRRQAGRMAHQRQQHRHHSGGRAQAVRRAQLELSSRTVAGICRPPHPSVGDPQRRAGVRRDRASHGSSGSMPAPLSASSDFRSGRTIPDCPCSAAVLPPGLSCSRASSIRSSAASTLIDIPQDLTRRRLYRHRDALDGRIDWNAARGATSSTSSAPETTSRFTSPTYVARLDPVAGFDIEVLRAAVEPASAGDPGTIVDVSAAGPLIVCGDGAAIRIVKARRGRQAMTLAQWHDYVVSRARSPPAGRSDAER